MLLSDMPSLSSTPALASVVDCSLEVPLVEYHQVPPFERRRREGRPGLDTRDEVNVRPELKYL